MARRRHYYDPGSNPQPSRQPRSLNPADAGRIVVLSRQLVRQMRRNIESEDFRRAVPRAQEMGWPTPASAIGLTLREQQQWREFWRACLDAELRGDGGRPIPPSQPARKSDADEQWERYRAQVSEYFAARNAWIAAGRVGDPPPHPIPPHTRGAHP